MEKVTGWEKHYKLNGRDKSLYSCLFSYIAQYLHSEISGISNEISILQHKYITFLFNSFTTTTNNFHIIFSSLDSPMDIYPFLSAGASWKFPSNEHFFTLDLDRVPTYQISNWVITYFLLLAFYISTVPLCAKVFILSKLLNFPKLQLFFS